MRFFQRPGFLATSALTVLLVLSWTNVLPLDIPIGFFSRTVIAPLYRIYERPADGLAKENADVRALAIQLAGDRFEQSLQAERTDHTQTIRTWAEGRSFPAPIIATVLTRLDEGNESFFLIDKGTRDGIRERMVAVIGKGVLVGRIAHVRNTTALLQLISAKGERFSVIGGDDERLVGVAEGADDANTLSIAFAPTDVALKPANIIATSGLDDGVPRGLLVGTVKSADPVSNSAWQQVSVRPFVRPESLTIVGVLVFDTAP
ncbi:rod shape-determining protein MreC [Candidatus Uhrbacteria bacterium]|nr:rod shape-determining protein MreC [Candidatus Uhrbacteria bacterium]